MTASPPSADDTPPRWKPGRGQSQPVIFLRKLVLLEELRPGAVKPIREVLFRAGLNIVWADPRSAEAASGGVRVAGHSAGKTTLCRILRWLLGEAHFAPTKLESRIASDLKDGWAVLTLEIDGQPWLAGRRFFDKADHCAVPGMTLEELYANGWPEGANAREFLAELKKATVGKLVRKRLPARDEEIPWTHILGWLARDQETSLVDVIAWRSSSKTPGTQGPTDVERHLIIRMILQMLSEPEGRELETYANDKAKRTDEKSAKVALQDRFEQTCRRLATIVPGEGTPVAGELLLPPARKIVQDKLEQLTRLNETLEKNTLTVAEQSHRQALSALFTARRGVTAAEKDLKKAEHHYNECEKIRVSAEKEIKQAALKCPPGRCGATKDEADAAECKAFRETPASFELEALLQKFTKMRDDALERYQQAKTELDEARLPIPDLERNEQSLSEHLETQKTEREKLVAEAAGLSSLTKSEKTLLDDAESALNTLEACDTRIKDLRDNMSSSRARQRQMLKSHGPTRFAFSKCFEEVLCFLLGPETSGHIEFSEEAAIIPVAESREPMSSGAIDALTVVALDLAAMLWSVTGHGHHPRLVIHDSPKVADMAEDLADLADLVQIEAGKPESKFITQGNPDNDIYLILAGKVSIIVNGREKAQRRTGQHVGEMATIDPSARRSASVVAIEQTVLARISEPVFTKLASKYPELWRRLALEIAERLRQRGLEVQPPNDQPHVFIGSSVEALPVARELQTGLSHDPFIVQLWTNGVFRASRDSVDSLIQAIKKADFAVLVLTADDTLITREVEHQAPRDNCIFELGLFMGALGRDRTFIVKPRGVEIKMPTDLLGITPLEYAEGAIDTIAARVGPVCTAVRNSVQTLGPK